MKKTVIWLSLLAICFYFNLSFAKGPKLSQKSIEDSVNHIVRPYFVALKNGDIKTLKALMAKDMYEERKVLFEQNKEYPDFLRNLYHDATFIIVSANEEGNDILVNAVIKYSDGRKNQLELYLINEDNGAEKQTPYAGWKISKKPSLE